MTGTSDPRLYAKGHEIDCLSTLNGDPEIAVSGCLKGFGQLLVGITW